MNRLIIADIKSQNSNGRCIGHYFAVAHNYYELFKDYVETLIAGGPIYQQQFKENLLCLPFDACVNEDSFLKCKLHSLKNSKELFKEAKDDIIVLQHASAATVILSIVMFFHRKSKLFLIQYNDEAINTLFKRMMYKLAKKKINGVICPNENIGNLFGLPYCVVPDYIFNSKCKSDVIPFTEKKYDVCFVGRIEKEKGVIDVAKKIAGTKYKMIIAGNIRVPYLKRELEKICQKCDNISLHIGYLSDNVYYGYINDSRFCILNYQGDYSNRSSGVVLDTIFHDVPVIGLDCKALDFIKLFNMGHVYDDLKNLDLDRVLTEKNYNEYLKNIELYKLKHIEYKGKLVRFLGL
ncbi:glycosyltransferase [Xylanibacter oryzae]|uniref:glycosyltransferase n=1 Tax=Xylanibacter oryzae TaxID=185293 RepID=UPI0004B510EE|nr:glycosyltransferase [Xylanibacter oryzae]